jgi:hypothetical protein
MSTPTVEITRKSAGPEGATVLQGQAANFRKGSKCIFASFMLEDYVDSVLAQQALADPDNVERVSWAQLKERLGL